MILIIKDGREPECVVYTDDGSIVKKLRKAFNMTGAVYEKSKVVGYSWRVDKKLAVATLRENKLKFVVEKC